VSTENIVKTDFVENGDVTLILWFPCQSFRQTQIRTDRWLLVFKFLRRSVDEKPLMRFQSENTVFQISA